MKQKNQRLAEIAAYIEETGYASVPSLMTRFDKSKATIIRDLDMLAKSGEIARVHGGAVATNSSITKYELRKRINNDLKMKIAEEAAKLVEDHDDIFIDSGTTCFELFKRIHSQDVTVFTSNLEILTYDQQKNIQHLYSIEGEVSQRSRSIGGSLAAENLKRINPNKVFFSSSGLSKDHMIESDFEIVLACLKSIANMNCCKIYLIDSSKIFTVRLFRAVPLMGIDYLITDSNISDKQASALETVVKKLIVV